MTETLPRLRMDLDFRPSPVPDRPGLLIRDPYGYSDATLIVPHQLLPALQLFDGNGTTLDLRQTLVEVTGQLQVSEVQEHLVRTLSEAGFLEDEVYERMRGDRRRAFVEAPVRDAVHAGSAYPDEADELRELFDHYLADGNSLPAKNICGIAAPHVSPEGGWESYRDAYRALGPDVAGRTFVILGTSHYGVPNRFGLTRKNFITPYGEARTDKSEVEWLEQRAPDAIEMEDYCHVSEHSIEFQVAFLQHLYGADVSIVPILVGPFYGAGSVPEEDENVRRFLGTLGELNARRGNELCWVLGVDMAHIGRRYGDPAPARAHQGEMLEVSARDKDRIDRLAAGDKEAFWELVREGGEDSLKWCGSAPFYAFLKAVPEARGNLLRYQHWQIDPQSVVSFAAMAFTR
jgi:AmmeMemoRadiSam system protein B